jgi:SAM-dependent methyltransferase
MHTPPRPDQALSAELRARIGALIEDGRDFFEHFDTSVRQHAFHPFVPADYDAVLEALLSLRAPGLRFLEWGSATGVVTIMADLLGFDAYGIEIDAELVRVARALAQKHGSHARFAEGSFLPAGYEWQSSCGDRRLGTIGEGRSGYLELQHPLEDFDIVYAYPWSGEEAVMQDVMRRFAGDGARLVLHGFVHTIHVYHDPRRAR